MKYKLSFVTFCKIIFLSLALGGCASPGDFPAAR